MKLIRGIIFGMVLTLANAGSVPPAFAGQDATDNGDVTAGAPPSTISSLQQLIDTHQVAEVRSVRNDSYHASLYFQADRLSYFVTLSHGETFWRVMQTDSVKDAENSFAAFAEQTSRLAEVDIDTMRLEAGKRYAQHLVEVNEARLHKLQQDVALQQQQGQQVAALQAQGHQKAVALSGDLRATSNQLDDVQQSIRKLEVQQGNPELNLPTGSSSVAPGATDAGTASSP